MSIKLGQIVKLKGLDADYKVVAIQDDKRAPVLDPFVTLAFVRKSFFVSTPDRIITLPKSLVWEYFLGKEDLPIDKK